MKNRIIPLILVPVFVLAGCSQSEEPKQIAVPTSVDCVNVDQENGSMQLTSVEESYCAAVQKGYTGTLEDWKNILIEHQSNPQQAAQTASSSGYSGGDVLLGAAAGAAVGALAANAMNSNRSTPTAYAPTPNTSHSSTSSSMSSVAKAPVNIAPSTMTTTSRGGFGGAVSSGG